MTICENDYGVMKVAGPFNACSKVNNSNYCLRRIFLTFIQSCSNSKLDQGTRVSRFAKQKN